jgi:hypothetical protein
VTEGGRHFLATPKGSGITPDIEQSVVSVETLLLSPRLPPVSSKRVALVTTWGTHSDHIGDGWRCARSLTTHAA